MTVSDTFVSVVAAVHNDGDIVEQFAREVLSLLEDRYANFELVLIDDGSSDQTSSLIEALLRDLKCLRYIRLSKHFGTEVAITAGLDTVIGDYVVVLQPDSDPPSLIPDIIEQARAGEGVVFGISQTRVGEPLWLRLGRRIFLAFGQQVLGLDIPRGARQFQVLSRRAVNSVTRMRDKYRHLRLLSSNVGYTKQLFPYEPIRRRSNYRHRSFGGALSVAVGLLVSSSTRPLRILSLAGVAASIVNLLYFVLSVAVLLINSEVVEAWTKLSLQISFMFFLLFLILAALSEYVGRILDESKDRPLYHIASEGSSSVLVNPADRRNVVRESRPESS